MIDSISRQAAIEAVSSVQPGTVLRGQAIIEALNELPAVARWLDIESAPVGTVVWAYGTIEGDYGYTADRKDMVKAVMGSNRRWQFAQPMGRHDPTYWTPEKWMHLPQPPVKPEFNGETQ